MSKQVDVVVCDRKPLSFVQRFYLVEVVKGLTPADRVVQSVDPQRRELPPGRKIRVVRQ